MSGQLPLDRVSVPGRNPRTPRLDNVSAHFPSGGFTAVVGRSGAGKTTLLELLTRRITPSEGRVLVDGRPVEDIDLMDCEPGSGSSSRSRPSCWEPDRSPSPRFRDWPRWSRTSVAVRTVPRIRGTRVGNASVSPSCPLSPAERTCS
ncbi:ATP-binding cassette domain-containing protein [Micrococcus luteus]|uniref:ATP-binding cassette domain-containing protein n=1 Tax=Micrococcus luteus TaxID=1270 RepID=UPI0036A38E51